jgi:ribosomal protein L24
MSILGINFTKIEAERKTQIKGKININNNISISNVKKHDFKLSGQESLKIEFKFTAKYEPGIGLITLTGDTVILDSPKKTEEIISQWKKDKKLPEEILSLVMNNLLTKCNIEALIIGREVGLPPTLNMPKVKVKE